MEENKKCCMLGEYHKCFGVTFIVLLGILCLFLLVKVGKDLKSYSYVGKDSVRNTITVSGKGELYTKPDLATFSFSITEESLDVSKASDALNTKMADIVENLKTDGIDEKDIKTTDYNIYPRYDYLSAQTYPYSGKQVLAAYVVTQGINIKIRDLSKAGKIISDLGTLQVTNMSGLTFTNDKYDDLVKQARDEAIVQARSEAKKLAKQLGVGLGDIVSFSEGANYPMYNTDRVYSASAMGKDTTEAVIPTGENKITSNVSITYEIK
ncbi:MAG: SIMPL domain-containing protein [Candidatus Paceibacterota bacterium]|jgi:hypothetical protein